jgi:oxygen-independent coproporphyrinogen III oxidase
MTTQITTTAHTSRPDGTLAMRLAGSPFQSYAYGYPHKTAYRPFEPLRALKDVWAEEDVRALFLYIHVPFCEMRCGFCNLFTMAKPDTALHGGYIGALTRQAERQRAALGDREVGIARMAVGGGTPTQLDDRSLRALFEQVGAGIMGAPITGSSPVIPLSCEVSPETLTPSNVAILREFHTTRVSMGVQSFIERETKAVRRPQQRAVVERALELMVGFEERNIDLIYGIEGQTELSWRESLEAAVAYGSEEIFLYPLYVRPMTGLDNSHKSWDDWRMDLYRQGRDHLLSAGYVQRSMRLFVRADHVPTTLGPAYHPALDGMVGLGAGARSYTRAMHYSSEWAVGRRGVVSIIEDWVNKPAEAFDYADFGFELDAHEQRRRFVVASLLADGGTHTIPLDVYRARFGTDLLEDLPTLQELSQLGLVERHDDTIALTQAGLDASDVIGPWLNSERVEAMMREFEMS